MPNWNSLLFWIYYEILDKNLSEENFISLGLGLSSVVFVKRKSLYLDIHRDALSPIAMRTLRRLNQLWR